MAKKTRTNKAAITVDLSGVEVGGKTVPEGKHQVSVDSASIETSNNSGSQYIKFEFEITEGKSKGSKLFHNCSLQPQALFNLKSVLTALGFAVPSKAFDLDLKELIGLECTVEVAHETYEGKKKSRVVEFIGGESEDDEEGDEEGDIEELLEELDKDELIELAEELGISKKDIKKAKNPLNLILEKDEADIQEAYDNLFGDEDDEEDDEDEADYSEMSLSELKAECKKRNLKVTKKMTEEDLIDMLEEDDE